MTEWKNKQKKTTNLHNMKIFLFVLFIHLTSAAAVLSYCAIWRQTFSNLAQPTDWLGAAEEPQFNRSLPAASSAGGGLSGTLPVTMHWHITWIFLIFFCPVCLNLEDSHRSSCHAGSHAPVNTGGFRKTWNTQTGVARLKLFRVAFSYYKWVKITQWRDISLTPLNDFFTAK